MKKVRGSYLFKITGEDGTVLEWLVDLKNGNGSVTKSPGNNIRIHTLLVRTTKLWVTAVCSSI